MVVEHRVRAKLEAAMGRFIPLLVGALLAAIGVSALATAGARSREVYRERELRLAAERRVEELKETLKEQEARPGRIMVSESGDATALKKEVETLRSALQAAQAKLAAPRPDRERPKPEDAAALQAKALDPSKTAADRLDALSKLRSIPGGRTEAVALALLDVLESGIESDARARILSNLKEAIPEGQAHRVIVLLKSDPEREVREEAAESLGPLKHLDVVRSALEDAANSDAAESVKRQARRALERN
jgi:hypothetical protein